MKCHRTIGFGSRQAVVEERAFGLSPNSPELPPPQRRKRGWACLLDLLHQLNETCNILTLVSGQQMVIFFLDSAFIHVWQ